MELYPSSSCRSNLKRNKKKSRIVFLFYFTAEQGEKNNKFPSSTNVTELSLANVCDYGGFLSDSFYARVVFVLSSRMTFIYFFCGKDFTFIVNLSFCYSGTLLSTLRCISWSILYAKCRIWWLKCALVQWNKPIKNMSWPKSPFKRHWSLC